MDIGRSVSRVGGAAQKPIIRELVGNLKLELSQYQEVAHFSQFGTEVDDATRRQIENGKRILAVLKQKPNEPKTFAMTAIILFALNQGYLSEVALPRIPAYKAALAAYISERETKLINEIEKDASLTHSIREQLDRVLQSFNTIWFEKKGETL